MDQSVAPCDRSLPSYHNRTVVSVGNHNRLVLRCHRALGRGMCPRQVESGEHTAWFCADELLSQRSSSRTSPLQNMQPASNCSKGGCSPCSFTLCHFLTHVPIQGWSCHMRQRQEQRHDDEGVCALLSYQDWR